MQRDRLPAVFFSFTYMLFLVSQRIPHALQEQDEQMTFAQIWRYWYGVMGQMCLYVETHSFTSCQTKVSSGDQVSKQVNKDYGRGGATATLCVVVSVTSHTINDGFTLSLVNSVLQVNLITIFTGQSPLPFIHDTSFMAKSVLFFKTGSPHCVFEGLCVFPHSKADGH